MEPEKNHPEGSSRLCGDLRPVGIMGLRGRGVSSKKGAEDKKGLFLQQEGSYKGVPVCVKKGSGSYFPWLNL